MLCRTGEAAEHACVDSQGTGRVDIPVDSLPFLTGWRSDVRFVAEPPRDDCGS